MLEQNELFENQKALQPKVRTFSGNDVGELLRLTNLGYTQKQIALRYAERGVVTRSGAPVNGTEVSRFMRSQGHRRVKVYEKGKRTQRGRPSAEQIVKRSQEKYLKFASEIINSNLRDDLKVEFLGEFFAKGKV